ncbi:MAG: GAF domain-containing protein [Planctomycetes bacterium]|nr:GAF domain-containing protein [Planctomycetota bacterium]
MATRATSADLQKKVQELEKALRESQHSCRTLLDAVNEKSEQLGIVNALLRSLGTAMDLREILQVFAFNLKQLCPYDRVSIALLDAERGTFRIPYFVKGGRVTVNAEGPLPTRDTVIDEVVRARGPVLRKNLKTSTLRFKSDTNFLKRACSCELLFPLVLGERVLGTFNVGSFEADALGPRHQQILSEVMPCVAVAVDRYLSSSKRS